MNEQLRRPRYADVVGTLALVVALSGGAYAAGALPRHSVGTPQLKEDAVTSSKIAGRAVVKGDLATASVGPRQLRDGGVRSADIGDGQVGGGDLQAGAVGSAQLADAGVIGAKLANGSVATVKLQDASVTTAKILNGTIGSADLAPGAVGTSDLADAAVTSAKIANNTVALADLVGADVSGTIDFSLGANTCSAINLAVGGAAVGDVALLTYEGATALPISVVMSPLRVVNADQLQVSVCNLSGAMVAVTDLGVRVVTLR